MVDTTVAGRLPCSLYDDTLSASTRAVLRSCARRNEPHGAQRTLWQTARIAAEPAASVGVAALLTGAYKPAPGERVAVVISGANMPLPPLDG